MQTEKKKIEVHPLDVKALTGFNPAFVKCVEAGNITEFVCLAKSPAPFPVVKIDKDHYAMLDTGEIFEYEHSDNKSQNLQAVRRTLANLRGIINANCIDEEKMRWVTLTYAENMTDTERLYSDFKRFWMRFCRWCKKQKISKPEYGCDNIGAYFSAYLADMPLEDFQKSDIPKGEIFDIKECSVSENGTEGKTKAFVKGARLHFYPSGMNIYRCSRGIKQPTVTTLTNSEYKKKKASVGALTFSHACMVVSASGSSLPEVENTILHEYYNKKRRKNQGNKE